MTTPLKACLLAISLAGGIIGGCDYGVTNLPEDTPVYSVVLNYLGDNPIFQDAPTFVHPGTLHTDRSTGTQAPWDRGEYFSKPSEAIREAVEASPDFSVCRLDAQGACEIADDRMNLVTLSAIDWSNSQEPRVWLTFVEIMPATFGSRTLLFELSADAEEWKITGVTAIAFEN